MLLRLSVDADLPDGTLTIRHLEIGGVTALVGPSGVGKTTVLEYVAGLRRPRSGRITCGGEVWFDSAEGTSTAPGARRVGYVPQDLALFPHLTARQNVAWGAEGPRDARLRRADALLAQFGLRDQARRRAARLSGGEGRRVALARALARSPAALLLDEPFAGLDAAARNEAIEVVRVACAQTHVPTLLVSHDFGDAAELSDQVAVIEGEGISRIGTPADLIRAPGTPFVAALVSRNHRHGEGPNSGRPREPRAPRRPARWPPARG